MIQYLALLRGINVGGKNSIKMTDLKACFEEMNFQEVKTYIQSGNVIFSSEETNKETLRNQIEHQLSKRFNYVSKIVLIPSQRLHEIVNTKPVLFGTDPEKFKYDVLFVRQPLSPKEVFEFIQPIVGVDEIQEGSEVVYFTRLAEKSKESFLEKNTSKPIFKQITIRNWNTTQKLYSLCHQEK